MRPRMVRFLLLLFDTRLRDGEVPPVRVGERAENIFFIMSITVSIFGMNN